MDGARAGGQHGHRMRSSPRRCWWLALAVAGAGALSGAPAAGRAREASPAAAVARLRAPDGGVACASVVAGDLLVTALDAVAAGGAVELRFAPGGRVVRARVLSVDLDRRLAVLRVPVPRSVPRLALARAGVPPGAELRVPVPSADGARWSTARVAVRRRARGLGGAVALDAYRLGPALPRSALGATAARPRRSPARRGRARAGRGDGGAGRRRRRARDRGRAAAVRRRQGGTMRISRSLAGLVLVACAPSVTGGAGDEGQDAAADGDGPPPSRSSPPPRAEAGAAGGAPGAPADGPGATSASPDASADAGAPAGAAGSVLTQHDDNARTGSNPFETVLTPANVGAAGSFGRIGAWHVNGNIVAQPLTLRGAALSAGRRNVVYVFTNLNDVYAFDADRADTLYWHVNLGATDRNWDMCDETRWSVGINATPVIDPATSAMFVVARRVFPCDAEHGRCDGKGFPACSVTCNRASGYFIYKLDARTGAVLAGPVEIKATYPRPSGGALAFDPYYHANRPALLLTRGVVYAAFGTRTCDQGPYHGWVIGYRASDLTQASAFAALATFPSGGTAAQSGIWQSGTGPAADDAGNIYLFTGNGTLPAQPDDTRTDLGNSALRLAVGADLQLTVAQRYAPPMAERFALQCGDTDVGAGAPVLLPGRALFGGGKQGKVYLLDADTMAELQAPFAAAFNTWHLDATQATCALDRDAAGRLCFTHISGTERNRARCYIDPATYAWTEAVAPNLHGGPVFFRDSETTGYVYFAPEKDYLKAFRYDIAARRIVCAPAAGGGCGPAQVSATVRGPDGMPGGFSSVSANGTRDGIVWTTIEKNDGQWQDTAGRLVASDALTLRELWRDDADEPFTKFMAVTVSGGRVFRATMASKTASGATPGAPSAAEPSARLLVYGLLPDVATKAAQLAAAGVPLGAPMGDEAPTSDGKGRARQFAAGTIIWSPGLGAHELHGPIRDRWLALGAEKGPTGYPASDVTASARDGGQLAQFANGAIAWAPQVGAHEVHGDISAKWAALGYELGPLGWPTSDETAAADGVGRVNQFQGGAIYWTAATRARSVLGPVRDAWTALGAERGMLGYPVSDDTVTPDGAGRFTHFQGGSIYWTAATGAHEVHGPIRDRWSSLGWERSPLGYPTSDEQVDASGRHFNTFQHGTITWTQADGAVVVPN